MDICTFWKSGELRLADRICLASMVKTGASVKLYSYGTVPNLPRGVELCDAEPVLAETMFRRVNPDYPEVKRRLALLHFSDLFRFALQRQGRGFWLDTDVFMIKPFLPDPAHFYLAHEGKGRLGVSAMYFPQGDPVVQAFCAWMDGNEPMPPWLGFRRRILKPLLFRLRGKPFTTLDAGITIFANDGVSRLARQFGHFDKAAPKNDFYFWTGRQAGRIYLPGSRDEILGQADIKGFHIHDKGPSNLPPQPGSFFEWALGQVRHLI